MKKLTKENVLKIGIPVIGLILLLVAIAGICSCVEDANTIPMETDAVVGGLEWGMSREEVESVLFKRSNCNYVVPVGDSNLSTNTQFLCYTVDDYQGIAGADFEMILIFTDNELTSGYYKLGGPTTDSDARCSTAMLEELLKGFHKAYRENTVNGYKGKNDLGNSGKYYVGSESLVQVQGSEHYKSKELVEVYVRFEDVGGGYAQQIIAELK